MILKIKNLKNIILICFQTKNIFFKNTINYNIKLHNILNELSAALTVWLDSEHCGLKYCDGSLALAIKNCKGSERGVGLYFQWDAFDIKVMVWDKIVTSSFGVAAQGVCQAHPSSEDTWHLGWPAHVLGRSHAMWCWGWLAFDLALAWARHTPSCGVTIVTNSRLDLDISVLDHKLD